MTTRGAASPASSAAPLRIEPVSGRRRLREFIEMARRIYASDPHWVPPLVFERLDNLDARKNPFFDHAEVACWIARRDGLAVGRISAQVNRAHLARHNDATGHFGFLEADDDQEIFDALLGTAEAWLRERDMKHVVGPFSLSINEESGLLIAGFDTPPLVMMGHARPYYAKRLAAAGYVKAKDLFAYAYDASVEPAPTLAASLARATRKHDIRFRPADMKRFASEVTTIFDIFNDAWDGNWGFVPFSAKELDHVAATLKPILRADDVAIAEIDGEAVAMAVSFSNVNEAIADLRGRLLPFGWAKLLWRLKVRGTKTARLALMGVRREFHGTTRGAALALGVIDTLRSAHLRRGTRGGELSWVLEDNLPTRRLIEMYGAKPYKTYRLFTKDLG